MTATSGAPASLLIVIGEAMAEEQVAVILERITDGLSAWNQNQPASPDNDKLRLDLNTEVRNFCNANVPCERLESGGLVVRYGGANLIVEVLVGPSVESLQSSMAHFMKSACLYKHIIHAGIAFAGSGSWLLQDGTFSMNGFTSLLQRADVATAMTEIAPNSTLVISCFPEGEWNEQGVKRHGLDKNCRLHFAELKGNHPLEASCAADLQSYISQFITYTPLETLIPESKVVGSIRFRRPTVHIFPAGEGDALLFGVNGFTILFDAGCNRKPCFWDFLRHVDRIDALLISRLTTNSVVGLSSFVNRLSITDCHPKLGYCFGNVPGQRKPVNGNKHPLLLCVFDEGKKMRDKLEGLNLKLHPCSSSISPSTKHLEPLTLYQKVGQGRLDMYILNPVKDSKELNEYIDSWTKEIDKNGPPAKTPRPTTGAASPSLIDDASIAVLMVWRPANPHDQIVRLLYPGGCPQSRILSGLEKLKHLDILKHAVCTQASLEASTGKTSGLVPKKQLTTKSPPEPSKTKAVASASKSPSVGLSPAAAMSPVGNSQPSKPLVPKTSPVEKKEDPSSPEDTGHGEPLLDLATPELPSAPPVPAPAEPTILEPTHAAPIGGEHIPGHGIAEGPQAIGPYDAVDISSPIEPGSLCLLPDQLNEHHGRAELEEPSPVSPRENVVGSAKEPSDYTDLLLAEIGGSNEESPTSPSAAIGGILEPGSLEEHHHRSLNPEAPAFVPKLAELSPSTAGEYPHTTSPLDPFPAATSPGVDSYHNGSRNTLDDTIWSMDKAALSEGAAGFQATEPNRQPSPADISPEARQKKMEDVMKEWGDPLGLPTPTAPNKPRQPSATSATKPKGNGPKEQESKAAKPAATASAPKRTSALASAPKAPSTTAAKTPPSGGATKSPNEVKPAAAKKAPQSTTVSKVGTATAPKPSAGAAGTKTAITKAGVKATPSPGAAAKPSSASKKPGPPAISYYIDLTYVPRYCNEDFFKTVRAKYYVLSTLHPGKDTLGALLNGKKGWNLPEEEVTVIPTYDSDTLSLWMNLQRDELASESIDVAPSCVRCTVNLEQQEEAKCAAYRLEL